MAPPAPTQPSEVTRDTHDTLEAALSVFDGPDSTTAPSGGRQQLRDLAEKHKQAAAKAVLLVSGAAAATPTPSSTSSSSSPHLSVTPAELRGVLSSLEQSAIALCSCCHGFTAGSGPSLKQSLKQLCGAVVGPTRELVDKLASGDADGLRKAFGLVWGACDELTRGPLDNKATLFRQLADVMAGIKGAAKELDELCEASLQELGTSAEAQSGSGSGFENGSEAVAAAAEASPSGAAANGGSSSGPAEEAGLPSAGGEGGKGDEEDEEGDDDDDDDEEEDSDDFRDMGTLSADELATAEAGGALLGAAQSVMRLISRPLLEGPSLDSSTASLEEWESLVWHAGKLRSSCEALVACLYPPHDELDELAGESEAVSNSLELMLGELPESYFGGEGAEALRHQVAAAAAEVEVAAGRMADELARRGRPAGGA